MSAKFEPINDGSKWLLDNGYFIAVLPSGGEGAHPSMSHEAVYHAAGGTREGNAILNAQRRDTVAWDAQIQANVTTGFDADDNVLYRIFKR